MLGKQSKLRYYEGPGQKSLMGTVKRRKSEPKNKKGKTKQAHSRTATIRDLEGQRAWM